MLLSFLNTVVCRKSVRSGTFWVLIGWTLSSVVRRIGGLKLYRQVRPAFLGLVLGDYLTRAGLAGLSAVFGIKAGVSYGW